jgi:hypothetical protein
MIRLAALVLSDEAGECDAGVEKAPKSCALASPNSGVLCCCLLGVLKRDGAGESPVRWHRLLKIWFIASSASPTSSPIASCSA